jgi:hypothetical protein
MNIDKMKAVLDIAHKSQNAVHMIGEAGIGKTEIVKQHGIEQGYHVEVLQLTVMDTGDLIGIPVVEDTKLGKVTTWAKPVWLQRVHKANEEGKHVIVFLDELGRSSTEIRQASLQMVLEGKIQEHSLGEYNGLKSLIVVADNPSDDYDTAEFDSALEDRFITLNVETSIEGFLSYARETGIEPVITDFLAEFPERLLYKPKSDDEKGSTPRAWEALSRILKATPKDSEIIYPLIASKVGKTVGSNFLHYLNNYINVLSVVDIVDYIKDMPLVTEHDQRAAGKKLRKITNKMEVITATELSEKMLTAYWDETIEAEVIVAYIVSLNREVGVGILKTWKEGDDKHKNFYMKDFMAATPNKWFITEVLKNAIKD